MNNVFYVHKILDKCDFVVVFFVLNSRKNTHTIRLSIMLKMIIEIRKCLPRLRTRPELTYSLGRSPTQAISKMKFGSPRGSRRRRENIGFIKVVGCFWERFRLNII